MSCPVGPHLHTVDEVCALLGCESQDWLVDRVRNGTFPARKIVRQLRFSDGDIQSIIDACIIQSSAAAVLPMPTSRRKAS